MRRLFIASTLGFWLAAGGFWLASLVPSVGPEAQAERDARTYTLEDVARHGQAEDCWMAIGAEVYDLTAYLPEHPAAPAVIRTWCGEEATEAYRTKTRGRAHSPYADELLARYRIGALATQP